MNQELKDFKQEVDVPPAEEEGNNNKTNDSSTSQSSLPNSLPWVMIAVGGFALSGGFFVGMFKFRVCRRNDHVQLERGSSYGNETDRSASEHSLDTYQAGNLASSLDFSSTYDESLSTIIGGLSLSPNKKKSKSNDEDSEMTMTSFIV